MSGACKIRGCPWPEIAQGLCGEHLIQAGAVGTCPECQQQFIQPRPSRPYAYCSRSCRCRANARRSIVVPRDPLLLRKLYIQEQRSVWKIARLLKASGAAVCRALQAVGIPRRQPGPIRASHCCEPGCGRSASRGRRCRFHRLLRMAAQHARYHAAAKMQGIGRR